MSALEIKWDQNNPMASYLKDFSAMPALHRFEEGAYANAAFMLGLTNWALGLWGLARALQLKMPNGIANCQTKLFI